MDHFFDFVEIQNFKSVKELRLDCKRVNLIIGKPNVGKSNILEAISLFCAPLSETDSDEQRQARFMSAFLRYNAISNLFFDQDISQNIQLKTNLGFARLWYRFQDSLFNFYMGPKISEISIDDFKQGPNEIFGTLFTGFSGFEEDGRIYIGEIGEPLLPYKGAGITRYYLPFYSGGSFWRKDDIRKQSSLHILSHVKKYVFDRLNDERSKNLNLNKEDLFLLTPYGENLFTILQTNPDLRKEVSALFTEYKLELVLDIQNRRLEIQKRVDDLVYKILINWWLTPCNASSFIMLQLLPTAIPFFYSKSLKTIPSRPISETLP